MAQTKLSSDGWPVGDSETARLIRAHDWARTPLGPIETWPQSLKSAVDLVLASPMPMDLLWGPERIQIYNEANQPFMGPKHPGAFGRPARETWAEIWDAADAIIHRPVFAGEAVTLIDRPWTLTRHGHPEETFFTTYGTPIRDETGAVAAELAMAFETTEAVKARTESTRTDGALRESEARLKVVVDLVGLSLYSLDFEAGVTEWDARTKAMWGLPPEAELPLALARSAIHPDDRPRVDAAVARALDPAGDGTYQAEFRVVGIEDGVERSVSAYGQATFANGRPVGLIGAVLDITERNRAQACLRESEERFRQFTEHSADVLWIANAETMQLEYLSPAYEKIWGEPREAIMRDWSRWATFLHPDDRGIAMAAMPRIVQGEVVVQEYRIVRPDGGVRWMRETVFPIGDEHGSVLRLGGIAQDMTKHDGALVYVVNADHEARRSVSLRLRRAGYQVSEFSSAEAFLAVAPVLVAGCVVIDIRRPEVAGLTVPKELKARHIELPVIITSGHGSVALAVQAMRAGAVDFLEAPYEEGQLLSAVASALGSIRELIDRNQVAALATRRISEMSAREREVLDRLVAGGSNKSIGKELGISPRTVEFYRKRVMERLGAQSLPEAVRMALAAGL
jgi:PAS domain S-box-containing protein